MIGFKQKSYPVFLVVDDGGHPYVDISSPEKTIPFDAYTNILKLAREFEIRIPIAFTMKYLDINNVSGCGQTVSYTRELIDLVENNQEYIEIGYHGLTHDIENHIGEFFLLDANTPVPEEIQRDHIHKSYLVFKDLGWKFPELFVPPTHIWELGVTDKILAEYGVKYLISKLAFKSKWGHTYKWKASQYLTLLPRTNLGIWAWDLDISRDKLGVIKKWIIPRNIINRMILSELGWNIFSKPLFNKPVHSYLINIGNFSGKSIDFWEGFFRYIKQNSKYDLVKSNEDVISKYFAKY